MTVDSATVVSAAMAAAAAVAAAMQVHLVLMVTGRGEMTLVALAVKAAQVAQVVTDALLCTTKE